MTRPGYARWWRRGILAFVLVAGVARGEESTFEARVQDGIDRGYSHLGRVLATQDRRVELELFELAQAAAVLQEGGSDREEAARAAHEDFTSWLSAYLKGGSASGRGTNLQRSYFLGMAALAQARWLSTHAEGAAKENPVRREAGVRLLHRTVQELLEDRFGPGVVSSRGLWASKYIHDTSLSILVRALHEAEQAGEAVPVAAFRDSLSWLVATWEEGDPGEIPVSPRAGWRDPGGYEDGKPGRRTSTLAVAGGAAATMICLSHLREEGDAALRARGFRVVRRAMEWLDRYASVTDCRGRWTEEQFNLLHPLVCLVEVELAYGLAGQWTTGSRRDWYREGAEYLLLIQSGGGGWSLWPATPDRGKGAAACQFEGITFLLRGTRPLDFGMPAVSGGDAPRSTAPVPAPATDPRAKVLGDVAARAMAIWIRMDGVHRRAEEQDIYLGQVARFGPGLIAPLVRFLEDGDPAVRDAAARLLMGVLEEGTRRRIPGDLVAVPGASPEDLAAVARAWRAYLAGPGRGLERDETVFRIRLAAR